MTTCPSGQDLLSLSVCHLLYAYTLKGGLQNGGDMESTKQQLPWEPMWYTQCHPASFGNRNTINYIKLNVSHLSPVNRRDISSWKQPRLLKWYCFHILITFGGKAISECSSLTHPLPPLHRVKHIKLSIPPEAGVESLIFHNKHGRQTKCLLAKRWDLTTAKWNDKANKMESFIWSKINMNKCWIYGQTDSYTGEICKWSRALYWILHTEHQYKQCAIIISPRHAPVLIPAYRSRFVLQSVNNL